MIETYRKALDAKTSLSISTDLNLKESTHVKWTSFNKNSRTDGIATGYSF